MEMRKWEREKEANKCIKKLENQNLYNWVNQLYDVMKEVTKMSQTNK
jgi:trehalose-6-phosphate synthase